MSLYGTEHLNTFNGAYTRGNLFRKLVDIILPSKIQSKLGSTHMSPRVNVLVHQLY